MKPEAQRIAIAEACGWKKAEPPNTPVWWKNGEWVSNVYDLPDYLNDLNAIHEAEKVLTPEQRREYIGKISDQAGEPWTHPVVSCPKSVSATAAQRAEAFLRTLNLWKTSHET